MSYVIWRSGDEGNTAQLESLLGWDDAWKLQEGVSVVDEFPVDADVADIDDVVAMVDRIRDELGRLDVLVNNAALASDAGVAPILDMDDDVWFRSVDVNLNGLYLVTRHAGRLIRDGERGGSIINISSMAGRQGLPNYGAYCATKFAMVGLTQQLALELAPHGIRVNCVAPGPVHTKLAEAVHTPEIIAAYQDAIPLGRYGTEPEIAEVIKFLCSPLASYVTGQVIAADGGFEAAGIGLPALRGAGGSVDQS